MTGFVLIGRNEGDRLRRSLASVLPQASCVVYVDSGSTDGSSALAAQMGAHVLSLDMRIPFTAARARNEGWRRLLALAPETELIHFMDGDCELQADWLGRAERAIRQEDALAVVCGRRRERHPDRSIYNRLCDIEWNTPVGEALACGGDALIRTSSLRAVGGYRDDLIAGEEPEMCLRMRRIGLRIQRLDHDMTWHDAAITRFAQWWRRTQRAGHAYAEGTWLHGKGPERHFRAETRRALAWGLLLPILSGLVAIGLQAPPWLLLAYPAQIVRLALRPTEATRAAGVPWGRALFLVIGRFPEAQGVMQFHWRRWRGQTRTLIEYK